MATNDETFIEFLFPRLLSVIGVLAIIMLGFITYNYYLNQKAWREYLKTTSMSYCEKGKYHGN